jgi:hypothetical protein
MVEFAACVGIDWSDQKHDLCLIDTASGRKESSVLAHSPEATDKWATALRPSALSEESSPVLTSWPALPG